MAFSKNFYGKNGAPTSADFVTSVRGIHHEDPAFWKQSICKSIGEIFLRPGFCDDNEVDIYFVIKENGKKNKPSKLSFTRKVARELCQWGLEILAEIDSTPVEELIASLASAKEFAFLTKNDSQFWDCPAMFNSQGLRARLWRDKENDFYRFMINSPRVNAEYKNWFGPAIIMSLGNFRQFLNTLQGF